MWIPLAKHSNDDLVLLSGMRIKIRDGDKHARQDHKSLIQNQIPDPNQIPKITDMNSIIFAKGKISRRDQSRPTTIARDIKLGD